MDGVAAVGASFAVCAADPARWLAALRPCSTSVTRSVLAGVGVFRGWGELGLAWSKGTSSTHPGSMWSGSDS